ncbi:MAG: hypothetical protein H7A24_08210 [Leptospiraceae bacterium]|nr:hypothetical protein [Leptospiraceae bacterium]MCP5511850.1 hypothetical protein [Leptospiraceae bacterium]
MIINFINLIYFILFSLAWISPIFPHHTGSPDGIQTGNSRFVDPFTGKREKPSNYFILSYDLQKGARGNKNIHSGIGFVEFTPGKGNFAFNLTVPYHFYQQRDRENAGRLGKVYLGAKVLPFFDYQTNWIFILESRLGFPSGSDTDRTTGGDYYLGSLYGTIGYLYHKFSLMGKINGNFPLTKLHPQNQSNNDGIPFWARTTNLVSSPESIELKKSTVLSTYLSYFMTPRFSLMMGFLYRTPYDGVEKTTSSGNRIPLIFREATAGFSLNVSEKMYFSFSFRNPLVRGKEFRIYESAYTASILLEF